MKSRIVAQLSSIGTSAQAAIPGLYAWAITVAPAAWSRGAPLSARIAAAAGVIALVSAPLVEGTGRTGPDEPSAKGVRSWSGPAWARIGSVWGFVLASAIVWALVPGALSSARLDAVRGVLGIVGWALFAFASAGPSLRPNPDGASRVVAGPTLKPRSDLPRGDLAYVLAGTALALGLQAVGWGVAVPERAVLVRLVTIASGIAVLSATTSIALARHGTRIRPSGALRFRRALPWVVVLALLLGSAAFLAAAR